MLTDCDGAVMAADGDIAPDRIEEIGERLRAAKDMIARRIIGQDEVLELALIALLSGGHALLVGVPGLGKTRLVEAISVVMGLRTNRVQFTPDLMPADILGSEILQTDEEGKRHFRFIEGPIFCRLLMADEINRASPRTQSALLQAMQETEVSVAGATHPLPRPFHVLATQNPIELEGTYPLPEAQLDRFLLRIDVDYPDRDAERRIVVETTGVGEAPINGVFDAEGLIGAQQLVRRMPVGEAIVERILDVVRSLRPGSDEASWNAAGAVEWGAGLRATQSLMLATRARALLHGRLSPFAGDVAALARPVLGHRMALNFTARSKGESQVQLIAEAVRQFL